jgi:hypothetical protein
MNITITITETTAGLYLTAKRKGVKYGQIYRAETPQHARKLFAALIEKYETPGGTIAIMRGN